VPNSLKRNVHEWHKGSTTVTRTIFNTLRDPQSLFVTNDGDIYVGSAYDGKVEKWTWNATESIVVMHVSSSCFGLFVDTANYLYCSLHNEHRVAKQSLDAGMKMLITVAGTAYRGSASNMLDGPRGIFVDINFDLYVADCENNRVQLFKFKQSNGITVAGKIGTLSIKLDCPTAVFLDADGYLFIVDHYNNRIVGSRPNGFYCLVGCSGARGSASYELYYPNAAAFDNYGNIFVADTENTRIQKFILMTNTFGK